MFDIKYINIIINIIILMFNTLKYKTDFFLINMTRYFKRLYISCLIYVSVMYDNILDCINPCIDNIIDIYSNNENNNIKEKNVKEYSEDIVEIVIQKCENIEEKQVNENVINKIECNYSDYFINKNENIDSEWEKL